MAARAVKSISRTSDRCRYGGCALSCFYFGFGKEGIVVQRRKPQANQQRDRTQFWKFFHSPAH